MVLHFDGLGNRVLPAIDGYLGDSIGKNHRTLDGITPPQQVIDSLISRLDFIAIGRQAHAIHLIVGMLVCENKNRLIDTLGNAGIQSFQLAKGLVDTHLLISHKL